MLFQIDGTFVVQLINFAIFFGLLSVVFLRPVGKAIRKRREYIDGLAADYDTYRAQALALRAEAEGVRVDARREAEATFVSARADASNVVAALASEYAQKAEAETLAAQRVVQGELASARSNEPQLLRELTDAMLDRALSESAR